MSVYVLLRHPLSLIISSLDIFMIFLCMIFPFCLLTSDTVLTGNLLLFVLVFVCCLFLLKIVLLLLFHNLHRQCICALNKLRLIKYHKCFVLSLPIFNLSFKIAISVKLL